jgi:hypothetical protein
MYSRDYRDLIGGGLLIALGGFAAIYAFHYLPIGTIGRMGPGWFPAAVSLTLCGLGFLIAIPAFFRKGTFDTLDLRSFVVISISSLIFAFAIRRIGLMPTVFLMTIVSTRADSKLSLAHAALLSACLAIFCALVFRIGLGVSVDLYSLPW